jgi:hypothetical protein
VVGRASLAGNHNPTSHRLVRALGATWPLRHHPKADGQLQPGSDLHRSMECRSGKPASASNGRFADGPDNSDGSLDPDGLVDYERCGQGEAAGPVPKHRDRHLFAGHLQHYERFRHCPLVAAVLVQRADVWGVSYRLLYEATGECSACWTITHLSGVGAAALRVKAVTAAPAPGTSPPTSGGQGAAKLGHQNSSSLASPLGCSS